MPLNNVGYRAWSGRLDRSFLRWVSIAETGVSISLKSRWIRRMLLVSWLPVLYFGWGFFAIEKYMEAREKPNSLSRTLEMLPMDEADRRQLQDRLGPFEDQFDRARRGQGEIEGILRMLPGSEVVIAHLMGNDARAARHSMWCWMLMGFFRYPQGMLMLVLIGLVVPPLISRDLRSRAYLMYFSRPIGRIDYLLGKLAVPGIFLVLITTLPAMALYIFGIFLSPGLFVIADTWDIPFRIVVASAVLIVPTSLLSLMYSSLTYESRFAAFAWFATWGLGAGAYIAVSAVQFENRVRVSSRAAEFFDTRWSFLSVFNMVGRIQEWVFGMETNFGNTLPLLICLAVISIVSLVVLMSRVTAPLRA